MFTWLIISLSEKQVIENGQSGFQRGHVALLALDKAIYIPVFIFEDVDDIFCHLEDTVFKKYIFGVVSNQFQLQAFNSFEKT